MAKVELAKTYDPGPSEAKIYDLWTESGFFNPDNLDLPAEAPSYTIILPPPNITDKLHLGHAAMLAIEDLFIRYKRLRGYRTLWLPGTDHAAIATQTVVEKKLKAETGQTRHELGREEFLKKVWEFLKVTQATILKQIKVMGASLDWSRLAFTLDEERQTAVKQMFVDLHKAGLLYRGERIVNWCPRCQSTLADDEVEYKEQKAELYTFRYDKNFPISIATTRPETKLGDTAVAVNPSDKRYAQFIGQTLTADFCGQQLNLKIIADRNVDMTFGTGALGVTPAHSLADWQMAEANDLPIIKVIDEHGLIREGFGDYSALPVDTARHLLIDKLRQAGLLAQTEEINNNLSVCYRCGTAVEPLPSRQWFIDVNKPVERLGGLSLKEAARQRAATGEIKFLPERFNKRYLDWLANLRDWCVSRQIWFGHSLPVWYRNNELKVESYKVHKVEEKNNSKFEIQNSKFGEDEVYVGIEAPEGEGWMQDSDTLDTWFSSGMWTFSTLGYPHNFKDNKKSGDLAKFHPTDLMETGYEIITLWVSRMVMMSLFALGEVPFKQVYLHGMVLDKQGKKMSKSKGNGIDPLLMVQAYGADAVRLALLIGVTPGTDFKMSEDKIANYRNFVNKFWNISRFILLNIDEPQADLELPPAHSTADRWILHKLHTLIAEAEVGLDKHDFALVGERLERFTWDELADWYLEIAKIEGNKAEILNYILNVLLKLWHPFMPFVTENLWQTLYPSAKMLMVQIWPANVEDEASEATDKITWLKEIVIAIRDARSANKIAPAEKITATIYVAEPEQGAWLADNANLIKGLKTGLSELTITQTGKKIEEAIYVSAKGAEIYLQATVDKDKDKARLEKEFVRLEEYITKLEAKLMNEEFKAKAPAKLVAAEESKLAQAREELGKVKERLH